MGLPSSIVSHPHFPGPLHQGFYSLFHQSRDSYPRPPGRPRTSFRRTSSSVHTKTDTDLLLRAQVPSTKGKVYPCHLVDADLSTESSRWKFVGVYVRGWRGPGIKDGFLLRTLVSNLSYRTGLPCSLSPGP